jgi:hypothetical protein
VAFALDDLFSILSGTAAYAAVLVGFFLGLVVRELKVWVTLVYFYSVRVILGQTQGNQKLWWV